MKIAILDYGSGNINSISNMLFHINIDNIIANNPQDIINSDKIILPGVGKFDTAIRNLRKKNDLLRTLENEVLEKKKPILGICLGMQIMLDRCNDNHEKGLSWIEGDVKKFSFNDNTKIPHMGWNTIKVVENKINLFDSDSEQRFYFCHSYFCKPKDSKSEVYLTEYGGFNFCTVIKKDNIMGVQFHPEKSHKFGMEIFKKFIK